MALPIRETPILGGRAAEEFRKRREHDAKCAIARKDYNRAKELYDKMTARDFPGR